MMKNKSSTFITFFKYNLTAITATCVDFLVLIIFTELLQFWYLFSGILGAISGGVVAFVLGRNWAFQSRDNDLFMQATKYSLVWITSIALNVSGLYMMVDLLEYQYLISKMIITIVVGLGFNYFMQKYFIFN